MHVRARALAAPGVEPLFSASHDSDDDRSVAYGARARLYDTVNQPYYDPKAAAIYTKRFNDACADIRRRVNMGNVRASSKVEFQRWV